MLQGAVRLLPSSQDMEAANASTAAREGAAGVKSLGQRLAEFKDEALEYVAEHPQAFLVIGALAILLIIVSPSLFSSILDF